MVLRDLDRFVRCLILGGFVALAACSDTAPEASEETTSAEAATPANTAEPEVSFADHVATTTLRVNEARIIAADAEPGNWLAHGRTYSEQRYSPLTQINADNVGELGLAWSFDTDTTRGLEASPIVIDGVMYFTGSWSTVFAVNAKTGETLWNFDPEVPRAWARYACCDVVNRGVAVWEGKVFVGTIDGRLIALDAVSGDKLWDVMTIDQSKPYTITGAPRVIKGQVIIGNGGAEFGVRGFFSAYDANTGEMSWRFYTVPGNPEDPFEHKELEAAAKTWTTEGKYWEVGGGGTAWDSMAYDPELNLLYVGTGNGSPWSRYVRSPGGGDNLYLSSILAIRPETGELVWHYQTTPGDTWDYTATQHIILAELEIDGTMRNVLMQAPKNGFFYVLDRATGELLSAEKYATVNWASHVDLETGRPVETGDADFEAQPKLVAPSSRGAHNWHPMAYNPDSGLVYIPMIDMPDIFTNNPDAEYIPGKWNIGGDLATYAALVGEVANFDAQRGFLQAWDPVAGKEVWRVEHALYYNGGVLTTAGNLVFQGTTDGKLLAFRADTGEPLWAVPVMAGVMAPPVTYTVDGEQYVAVMAGWGGAGMTIANPQKSAAAKYGNNGRLLVFKIGGEMELPVLPLLDTTIPEQPKITPTESEFLKGRGLYYDNCLVCHGYWAISSGVVPDLRLMSAETHDVFEEIVHGGLYEENGMPGWSDYLSKEEVRLIHGYVIHRANISRAAAAGAVAPPFRKP